ncbi:NACHT, LRR and PYD domains-containing protein 12-like isoform X2 [Pelodiscus sinensis]|uniref:NACHT, LRR and PYD domains-containing protein 12-like isoform X2 n=1 Tax=Pelodiscus sinensis TaxID=13735 RepID=UPI003F6D8E3B
MIDPQAVLGAPAGAGSGAARAQMPAPQDSRPLLQQHQQALLDWLKENPQPLLRWLHDAGALSQAEYFALLETAPPPNQVIALLEWANRGARQSQDFLRALGELGEAYGAKVQQWLQANNLQTQSAPAPTRPVSPRPPKSHHSFLRKILRKNGKKYKPAQEGPGGEHPGNLSFRKAPSPQLKAALQRHRASLLRHTEQLCANKYDLHSCGHIEICFAPLLLAPPGPAAPPGHEYRTLASRWARLLPLHAPQQVPLARLLAPLPPATQPPRRVALSGAAGIGKSAIVQKILHDWALGAAFQGPLCALDFCCRELSMAPGPVTLEGLICDRRPHLQEVLPELLARPRDLLLLLDGLDEFPQLLDSGTPCHQTDHPAHARDVVRGLLEGTLLPGATVVVTSRPCPALSSTPFDRHLLILGFHEAQLEDYLCRFFRDAERTAAVSSYIAGHPGLAGLCFIPLYCFILCTALAKSFPATGEAAPSLPATLTDVYRCYLATLLGHGWPPEPGAGQLLRHLGRLAYAALLAGKRRLSIEELREFGFDSQDLPVAFLNPIFLGDHHVGYRFFHVTVQEFLAALYCVAALAPGAEDLTPCLELWWEGSTRRDGDPAPSWAAPDGSGLLRRTQQLLQGRQHCWEDLEMFARFFMGLLPSGMRGELAGVAGAFSGDMLEPAAAWLGRRLSAGPGKRLLSLVHCVAELRQEEVTGRVARELEDVDLYKVALSPADCAALAYVLGASEPGRLKNLNLSFSNMGMAGLRRIRGLLHRCETLQLRYNSLDTEAAALEAEVLRSPQCQVKRLMLCGNCLGSEGARRLWEALQDNRTLQELYLDITGITDSGLENMLPCLQANTSLRLLTIVGNRLSEAGQQVLAELRRCKPGLTVISTFESDMGLLQAYLDWVEEIKADPDQMDAVKNADALRCILSVLPDLDNTRVSPEARAKIQELKKELGTLVGEERC